MRGAIHLIPHYAFMAWCSVKKRNTGTNLPLPPLICTDHVYFNWWQ